jgi:hypothetical protein
MTQAQMAEIFWITMPQRGKMRKPRAFALGFLIPPRWGSATTSISRREQDEGKRKRASLPYLLNPREKRTA